ncbi:MAG TPA: isoleucine--tRNA ligase [Candidatus Eisenbacteria bacterium]|nr:isoleucine--tRNA ligase [Candidatus Eisenbacteria bacterium]
MRYRDTLHLPKTDFPMRAELPKREPEALARWQALGIYERLRRERPGQPRYVLHDGPPYSNNHIHLGTAANKIWKDVVVRYHTLLGEDAPYVPGWDNHGMPIENEVSREFRARKESPDRLTLRRRCREYAQHWFEIQRDEFIRLGVIGDWEHPYLTMASDFEAELIEVFAELSAKGFIYRGLRSIHWCPTCASALAEAEIEYEDDPSPSIFVAFPHRRGERRQGGPAGARVAELDRFENLAAVAWTTTPWTLPANLFLMVGPRHEYVVVEADGGRYLLAAARVPGLAEAAGWTETRELARFKGEELLGAVFENPMGRPSPFVDGMPYVLLEEGTGIVHSAPGHGKEDFQVGTREGFPALSPVDAHGRFTQEAGPWAGKKVFAANPEIIADLKTRGRLVAETSFVHPYPHCWRCKGPVIFRATEQWFMSIDHQGHREKALEAVRQTRWDPPGSRNRIQDAVAGRPDWCLSRQRSWGVGIPALYCDHCGEAILDPRVMRLVAERSRRLGSDDWYESGVEHFLPEGFRCPKCDEPGPFRKETDILDVWFDSGCTHRAVLEKRPELTWPADLYLEGPDQHRGWFNSSLMVAVATRGRAPYRAVQTHGWILDAEGRAMHKSLGNVISPLDVIKSSGADIVRLWACSADWRTDVRVGDEILTRVSDSYRKVRNTFRFLLANLDGYAPPANPKQALAEVMRDPLNAAFLGRLQTAFQEVREAYVESRNHIVVSRLVDLCVTDLSAVFLDVRKDALYTLAADDPLRRSTQTVLAYALEQLVFSWGAMLPFTADEVWLAAPWLKARAESLFLAAWPDSRVLAPTDAAEGAKRWESYLAVREAVYRALEPRRASKEFATFAEVSLTLAADGETLRVLESMDDESWRTLFLMSEVFHESVNGEGAALEKGAGPAQEPLGSGLGKLYVLAEKTAHARCERCWIHRDTVGKVEGQPTICQRCADALPRDFVPTS